MTTTWTALGSAQQGQYASDVPAGERRPVCDLDAIGRGYDAAKADIADMTGPFVARDEDPWPQTEAIDVRLITPPPPAPRRVVDPPADRGRPWRAVRRWIGRRTGIDLSAGQRP
jgi:hypothetical protein